MNARAHARTPRAPDPCLIAGAPLPGAAMRADRNRPFIVRVGKYVRGFVDRLISGSSLVPDDAVLDVRTFPWTQLLRERWEAIRNEAVSVALADHAAPSLATVSPDHRAIAEVGKWRSFFLWGYGHPVDESLARCPATRAAIARVPGLSTAFFSILAPGTHIPEHRGVTKGLITCHLGLIVPRDGDARMRVGDRILRWAEGETLVFDDTRRHEVWNETQGTRVVLVIQFARPLRNPGRWFADLFLGCVRRSAFVQETRANVRRWNAAVRELDA